MKRRKAESCYRKQERASAGEDVRRLEPRCTCGGNVNCAAIVGHGLEVLKELT